MALTYIIIETENITQEMFDVCLQGVGSALRSSNEATPRSWLKYEGNEPAIFNGITKYTEAEKDTELLEPEWQQTFPPE